MARHPTHYCSSGGVVERWRKATLFDVKGFRVLTPGGPFPKFNRRCSTARFHKQPDLHWSVDSSVHSAEDEHDAIGMLLISSSKENNSDFYTSDTVEALF